MLDLRLVSPLAKIFPDRAPDSAPVLKKASALRGEKYSFQMAWQCARPNAIVTVVAMYGEAQSLPLPEMYGKNLTFKTGGVDGCDCNEILTLIRDGKINTTPLLTHRYPLNQIEEAYELFEQRRENVIKVAVTPREL